MELHQWQRINPALDITALTRVFVESAPKPAAAAAAAAREKIA